MPEPKGHSIFTRRPAVAVFMLLFFGVLWRLDFPKPMVDDLFYCGAGLHMAGGGDFSNPLTGRVHFPSHYFYSYPPIHSYAILGWCKVWGVSAASMTGLVIFVYWLASVSMVAVLHKHGSPVWLAWLVPLAVATGLLEDGLRPEPLSIGLAMAGFAIIECGGTAPGLVFTGFLLMFAGGSAAPRMVPFEGALALLAAWRLWKTPVNTLRRLIGLSLAVCAALAVTIAAFLFMIDFRLREFWETFHYAASFIINGGRVALVHYFLLQLKALWIWPFLIPATIAAAFSWRGKIHESTRVGWVLVLGFTGAVAMGALAYGGVWWVLATTLFFVNGFANSKKWTPKLGAAFLAFLLLCFALSNKNRIFEVAGIIGGKIHPRENLASDDVRALRPGPGRALMVDEATARYVFDYRIPEGAMDYGYHTICSPQFIDTQRWKPGDVFILGNASVEALQHYKMVDIPPVADWKVAAAHVRMRVYPREAFVVRRDECKTPPPEFTRTQNAPNYKFNFPSD